MLRSRKQSGQQSKTKGGRFAQFEKYKKPRTPYYISLEFLMCSTFISYMVVTILSLKKIPKHKTKKSKILSSTHKIMTIVSTSLNLFLGILMIFYQDMATSSIIGLIIGSAIISLPKVLMFINYDKLHGKQFLKYYTLDILVLSALAFVLFMCICVVLCIVGALIYTGGSSVSRV